MKTRRITIDIVYFLLVLYFFYEGIQKVAYFDLYSFWVGHVPWLKRFPVILTYGVPIGELVLAVLFLIPSRRIWALYGVLVGNLLFVVYIFGTVWVKGFFFPVYNALWSHPTWFQKLIIALVLIWLSFVLILMEKRSISIKKYFSQDIAQ